MNKRGAKKMQCSKTEMSSFRKEGVNEGSGWGHFWITLVIKCTIRLFRIQVCEQCKRWSHYSKGKHRWKERWAKTQGAPEGLSYRLRENWSYVRFSKILSREKRKRVWKNFICVCAHWRPGEAKACAAWEKQSEFTGEGRNDEPVRGGAGTRGRVSVGNQKMPHPKNDRWEETMIRETFKEKRNVL